MLLINSKFQKHFGDRNTQHSNFK